MLTMSLKVLCATFGKMNLGAILQQTLIYRQLLSAATEQYLREMQGRRVLIQDFSQNHFG